MIQVGVRRDLRGRIRHLSCSGHARFDPEGGVDVVCAGVSALMGALAIGLTQVVGAPVSLSAGDARLLVRVPARMPEELAGPVQVLLETTVLALQEIQENYQGSLKIRWLRPR
ncbi:MAG: ribosomal-processing cysteine protease Prp [Candidatus Xenobium sp.]|nr:ribosomal-processing cysteine protease Prp [Burkholderiales bacterium]